MDIPPTLQNLFSDEIVSINISEAVKCKSELERIIDLFGEESASVEIIIYILLGTRNIKTNDYLSKFC